LLFDNDDIEVYFKLYLLLYADDTVIFAETAAELQSALNAMYLYCETKNSTKILKFIYNC
jgi:transcriptional antiterminator Rof (Rho-off)